MLDHEDEKRSWGEMVPEVADHEERKAKMNFRVRPSMWADSEEKKEDGTFLQRERTSRAWRRRQRLP